MWKELNSDRKQETYVERSILVKQRIFLPDITKDLAKAWSPFVGTFSTTFHGFRGDRPDRIGDGSLLKVSPLEDEFIGSRIIIGNKNIFLTCSYNPPNLPHTKFCCSHNSRHTAPTVVSEKLNVFISETCDPNIQHCVLPNSNGNKCRS